MASATLSRLGNLTHVRREETKVVLLMMLYGFLAMTSYYVVKPVRNAVFVERLGADNLPYVYIITAIVVSLVMVVYSKYVNRVGHLALLLGTFAFLAANLVIFRWLLIEETLIASGIFYIWGKLFPLLIVSQFWLVGNLLFTTRQAKRLFGPVGVGLILGGIAGSSIAGTAAERLGSENLLLAAAGILGLCAVIVLALASEMRDQEGRRRSGRLVGELSGDAVRVLFESHHLRWIAALLFTTILVSTLIDWQFNRAVELFIQGEDNKTQFFGRFFLVLNIASVAIQVLLTSFVLRKFGVGVALLVLPAGILISSVGVILLPILAMAVLSKGAEGALRYSLDQSTRELLFLPLPTDVKYKVKPLIDLAVYRGGTGVGGVLLLVFTNWLGFEMTGVAIITVALVVLWLIGTFHVKREFKDSVKRLIGIRDVNLNDLIVHRLGEEDMGGVRQALQGGGGDDEVIYALGLLGHQDPRAFTRELRELLQHDAPEPRARALKLLTGMGHKGVVPEARALLVDPDLDVRIAAMEYVCRFGTDSPADELRDALADEAFGIRAAAIAVILRHSGGLREGEPSDALGVEEVRDAGGAALEALSSEEDLEARLFAARLLVDADLESERGRAVMRLLLDDPDPSVRHAAFQAATTIRSDEFLDALIERLAAPQDRNAAVEALSKRATEIRDRLFERLRDSRAAPSLRLSIPRILRDSADQDTVDRLVGVLRSDDTPPQLRYEILKTLGKLRRDKPELDFAHLELDALLNREVRDAYLWARRHMILSEGPGEGSFLARILSQRMEEAAERAFRVLGLEHELEDMEAAFVALRSPDELMRLRGFELVDNALPLRRRALFDPLLNPEKSWKERAAAAEERFKVPAETEREILETLCGEDGICVRALARAQLGRPAEAPLTAEALREEMASRISLVLGRRDIDEEIDIMDILQRADTLRKSKVFGNLRGEELAGIAALVEEERCRKGEMLTGEALEDYLYVVVEGRIGTVKDDTLLASAGPGEVFFDAGLLDGLEPEGDLKALEDSRVLRLSRTAFTRIMEERFTVVRGLLAHMGDMVRNSQPAENGHAVSNGAGKGKSKARHATAGASGGGE